ncbi:G-type lectin S-receptor-like serine/threonine-protein kinase SD2-5 [Coffea eugenioides]|uniref:G-type lectin S-receptor-like serine/threonine-protein kinase SD2-5 n=1 Tax=Coffea eugenioides TaxID=49369 RepID=UPI000F607FD9|nr:G-type lectin S-receptor-like serine/threonine-protein kinase SD2-5 [Coffea eugenioides]
MAFKHKPYHAAVLLSSLLIISSSKFLGAKVLNYSSTAYLSTLWPNHPSQMVNTTEMASVTPILLRKTDGPWFMCGFYCNMDGSSCLFGVLIFQNLNSAYLQFPQLVWSANRNNPVPTHAALQLTQDGDLVLINFDLTVVWSSNTRGKPVSGINLTDTGNLVLFGRNNETIWQSFDHPTDSLLWGQKLVPGQKLRASVSESNMSQGLFCLSVTPDGLMAYMESNPPQRYYTSRFHEGHSFEFNKGRLYGWDIPYSSSSQFLKFEPDGHLKVYQWDGMHWRQVADLLSPEAGDCGYPTVCGKYGVCKHGQCGCPDAANYQSNFFRQIDSRHPNLGCSALTPISCDYAKDQSFLELKNTYYFAFESSLYSHGTGLDECKNSCLNNCSCKAALFAYDGNGTSEGGCLLLNEVFSIINNENHAVSVHNTTLFVKVSNVKNSRQSKVALVLTLGAFSASLCVVGCCLFLFRKRLKELKEIEMDLLDHLPGMPKRYSYEMLKKTTENFSRKLGQGGFGSVYEGILDNGTKIAVKYLDGFGQVKDSFLVEVNTIGSIHHINLVKLVGYCSEKSHRLLIYEYMANGSLDTWIFGGTEKSPLPWHTRRKIILDIAKGLAYLHEECCQKIIHFDVKPQNVLLDQNFNAKVSDFGLSKLLEKDQSRVVTRMRGTPGYLAPEWLHSAGMTEKVDVYSFGVVIMEIICGRKNVDWSMTGENSHLLSLFKRKALEERLEDIVDKKSEDMLIHMEEAIDVMKIGAWCLQSDFTKRPSMSLVVKALEGLVAAETNLNFDFTNSSVVNMVATADQEQEAVDDASPLLPSVLSGPR